MRYRFTARTAKGELLSDKISAPTKKQAKGKLENRGLIVDSLNADWIDALNKATIGRFGSIPLRDKLIFTRNLALMIKAGINIDQALSILGEQTSNVSLKRILGKIQEEVQAGTTLSEAMHQYPRAFDQLFVNIIAASEKSGTLAESLEHLANQIKRQHELKSKIQGALFYPILVVVSTVAVGIALSIFVLPKITSLFTSFETELPWTTRAVIGFSTFMQTHTLLTILIVIGLVLLIYIIFKVKFLKPLWHRTFFRLPIIGKIVQDFNLALFSRTLCTLLVSGVPVNQALDITARTLRNVRYKASLDAMVIKQQSGEALGFLLSQYPRLYPPIVHRMIAVGEESGNLDESLNFLAEFHEEELDYMTKNISTIVEPVLLITVGIMVAVLALAIITPIYQITGSFQPR